MHIYLAVVKRELKLLLSSNAGLQALFHDLIRNAIFNAVTGNFGTP